MRWKVLALCLALLAPIHAHALTGWFSQPNCTGTLTGNGLSLQGSPVAVAYYCVDSTTAVAGLSLALRTTGYRLTLTRIGDSSASAAGSCAVEIYETPADPGATVASVVGLPKRSGDVDGDGVQDDQTLNGAANRRALRDFRAVGITIQTATAAAGSEQCVIVVMGTAA